MNSRDINMHEAHKNSLPNYGGAYDIDPYSYFTKEELVGFGESIVEKLNELETGDEFSDFYQLQEAIFEDDYRTLTLVVVDKDGNEVTSQQWIDFRKIKAPDDIYKFKQYYVTNLMSQFNEIHADYDYVSSRTSIDTLTKKLEAKQPCFYDWLSNIEDDEYAEMFQSLGWVKQKDGQDAVIIPRGTKLKYTGSYGPYMLFDINDTGYLLHWLDDEPASSDLKRCFKPVEREEVKSASYLDHLKKNAEMLVICPKCRNYTVVDVDKDSAWKKDFAYGDFCVCEECAAEFKANPQYNGTVVLEDYEEEEW